MKLQLNLHKNHKNHKNSWTMDYFYFILCNVCNSALIHCYKSIFQKGKLENIRENIKQVILLDLSINIFSLEFTALNHSSDLDRIQLIKLL